MLVKFSALLALCMAVLGLSAFANPKPDDYFPLEKGNYWIYQGETKFLVPKKNATKEEKQKGLANEPRSEVLTWKMEVVDTLERPNVFAARIKGGPRDLAWYEPGQPRGDYVILRVGNYRYYQYSAEQAVKLWEKLQKSDPGATPLGIEEGELILDFPMADGKVFAGDLSGYLRDWYCWVVEGGSALSADRFPGAEKFPNSIEYHLSYRTNPDHQFLNFATGVGIVAYTYGHHGTLAKTSLLLIEFGKVQPTTKER